MAQIQIIPTRSRTAILLDMKRRNPRVVISDNNTLTDGRENIDKSATINLINDANQLDPDTDDDGLLDGADPDPKNHDSDGDDIFDGTEMGVTSPVPATANIKGTDEDGLNDGDEDKDKDGKYETGETDQR